MSAIKPEWLAATEFIDHEHPDHRAPSVESGSVADTRHPPGTDPASTDPRNADTRSRTPMSPSPDPGGASAAPAISPRFWLTVKQNAALKTAINSVLENWRAWRRQKQPIMA